MADLLTRLHTARGGWCRPCGVWGVRVVCGLERDGQVEVLVLDRCLSCWEHTGDLA